MTLTNELIVAAERTFHAAGSKPKDVAGILSKLASDYQCEASVEGGLLTLKQGGVPASVGNIVAAYREKHPRDFYGEAGEVRYKSDLAGDIAAKARFIAERGISVWDALPANEKSPGAQNVTNEVIPHAGMKAAEYARLSRAEKAKLAGEIGPRGIERILARR